MFQKLTEEDKIFVQNNPSGCPKELYCSFNQQWINKALHRTGKAIEQYDIEFALAGLACDGKRYPSLGTLDGDHYKKINMGWKWQNATPDLDTVFMALAELGLPISAWLKKDHRSSQDFVKGNIAMVDIDDGMTIDDIKNHEFYNDYSAGYYTSPSHTEEAHRLRLIFLLERVITNEADMRAILTALINVYGGDEACKDATRIFYGSQDAQYEKREGMFIPNEIIDDLIEAGTPKPVVVRGDIEYAEVTDTMRRYVIDQLKLNFIGDYNRWFTIAAGLKNGGYTLANFQEATHGGLMRSKSANDCATVWNGIQNRTTGRHATMGSVWKLIGGVKKYYETHPEERPMPNISNHPMVATIAKYKTNDAEQVDEGEILDDFDDSVFYSDKYCDAIPKNKAGTFPIKSYKGSGKTFQLEAYVDACKQAGRSVLVIGHRQVLLSALAERLGLDDYKTIKDENITKNDYLCICINSIKRIALRILGGGYDVVILDESEQLLEHWQSGGGKQSSTIDASERPAISVQFIRAIERAETLIALDADLSMLTIKVIADARPEDLENDRFYPRINTYKPAGKTVNLWTSKSALERAVVQWVGAGESVFVATNNKAYNIRLAEHLQKLTDMPVFNIHADNSKNKANREILSRLCETDKEFFEDRQDEKIILITSPSVGTGYDIQSDFEHVVGFFDKNITTHWDIDQHISRVRSANTIDVFIAPTAKDVGVFDKVDAEKWYEYLEANYEALLASVPPDFVAVDTTDNNQKWYKILLSCKILAVAKCDVATKYPKRMFKGLKQSQNCEIVVIGGEDGETPFPKDPERVPRDELKAALLQAQVAEYDELPMYHNTFEDMRFRIEGFFGESIEDNPELVDWWIDRRRALYKYNLMEKSVVELLELDAGQVKYHGIDRQNYSYSVGLLKEFLTVWGIAGVESISSDFNPVIHNQHERLDRFKNWYGENKYRINKYLGKKVYEDIDKNLFRMIKGLFEDCGLELQQYGKARINGKNTRLYRFNLDHLEWVRNHVELVKND